MMPNAREFWQHGIIFLVDTSTGAITPHERLSSRKTYFPGRKPLGLSTRVRAGSSDWIWVLETKKPEADQPLEMCIPRRWCVASARSNSRSQASTSSDLGLRVRLSLFQIVWVFNCSLETRLLLWRLGQIDIHGILARVAVFVTWQDSRAPARRS